MTRRLLAALVELSGSRRPSRALARDHVVPLRAAVAFDVEDVHERLIPRQHFCGLD
jgi:hypothetical protein